MEEGRENPHWKGRGEDGEDGAVLGGLGEVGSGGRISPEAAMIYRFTLIL